MESQISYILGIKKRALEMGASDIFLAAGAKPACRVHKRTIFFEDEKVLEKQMLEYYVDSILSEDNKKKLETDWELDFAQQDSAGNRFRGNVTRQKHGLTVTFRTIPQKIPNFADLGLPQQLLRIPKYNSGLVLVAGSMGSGKTTTLASMVDMINEHTNKRIITIEDPVEFHHENKKSLIDHRELGHQTHDFKKALKSALRQGADVILVGELRDLETISLAVTAAETGALVLATVHSNGAANTLHRLIDVFPAAQQMQIQTQLADSLRAVVWQMLVHRKDGKGQVAAIELMFQNYAISNLIRDGKIHQIDSMIEINQADGMISIRKMLEFLIGNNIIDVAALPERLAHLFEKKEEFQE